MSNYHEEHEEKKKTPKWISILVRKKAFRRTAAVVLPVCLCMAAFLIADRYSPIDLLPRTQTRVILAANGEPLRAFADENGVWRYPVTPDQVSPRYIEALLGYEDRWFYYHPGVNPLALTRAGIQWLKTGHVVSGGSTLTMQVARLRRPVARSLSGKLVQIFRALQLEWHYSKDEILTYYLNHAPFGGTYEGVQAASYAYFDHGAETLTYAQAALLAVMPQAPSRYRPDRYPEAARQARDKLLDRLVQFGIWTEEIVTEARQEPVTGWPVETHLYAPLLARRLHQETASDHGSIETLIDYNLQLSMEQLARDYAVTLPPRASLAILAMNNHTGAVKAYVGSADFFNDKRVGQVDMVTALRSPGSTLKPFIYGMALDQGLIHSQSLLMDVPIRFGDYQPVNFKRSFSGPVSAATALSESLNLPAVQLLDHLGPRFFYARMVNAGIQIKLPEGAVPNLSMALGGLSTSLEDLVRAFSCLGREGIAATPRLTADTPLEEERLMSAGAAWIIQDMLLPENNTRIAGNAGQFAVKTGTSYGYRDAWALGVDAGYTVGVWVGRPDGTPIPGHYGAQTATPLLNLAFQLLPGHENRTERPETVTGEEICWPDGQRAQCDPATGECNCESPRNAWVLEETTPKTLTSTSNDPGPAVIELDLLLTEDNAFRIPAGCETEETAVSRRISLWPRALESWIPASMRRKNVIPTVLPQCADETDIAVEEPVLIEGITDGEVILKKDEENDYPILTLRVQGGNGPWYWFENSVLAGEGPSFVFAPAHPGQYQLLVMDQSGAMDKIGVEVF